jgi:hypothetical protein
MEASEQKNLVKCIFFPPKIILILIIWRIYCRCTLDVESPPIESLGQPQTAGNLLGSHLRYFQTAIGLGEKGLAIAKAKILIKVALDISSCFIVALRGTLIF